MTTPKIALLTVLLALITATDIAAATSPPLTGQDIAVGDITLHVVDEGSGPAVLLLHGFPDSAQLWRHQVPALVDAGYRVIVPDLRGFGGSERPAGVDAYRSEVIVGDLLALLSTLGIDRAHVVGHDWGAAFAWSLAAFAPDVVDRLIVLSVGHPMSFGNPADVEQQQRSFYMLYFQFEGVAEAALPADDWALWRAWFGEHSEQDTWFADLSRPGALTAALNLYRANLRPNAAPPAQFPAITAPTMGIWSSGDTVLTERQMQASGSFIDAPFRYERIEDASHWIPLDAPDRTSALILSFLDCPVEDSSGCADSDAPSAPDEGDGCSASGPGDASWALALLGLALIAWRRRPRRS